MSVRGSGIHWDATFDENAVTFSGTSRIRAVSDEDLGAARRLQLSGCPPGTPLNPFIENLVHTGVTAGGGCGAGQYCGEDSVLRQQMAPFLLKSAYGAAFTRSAATGTVSDDGARFWSIRAVDRGLALRHGRLTRLRPPPDFLCTARLRPVNRQQMSGSLLKNHSTEVPLNLRFLDGHF